jgi:hypothetical protein
METNNKIKIEDGFILIQTHLPHYVYDIDIRICKSDAQKLDWLEHLKCKNWFTKELELEFINLIKTI